MGKKDQGKRGPGKSDDDATAAEAAMRKWRRRYEALRDDYEDLLERIEELEGRIGDRDAAEAMSAARLVPGTLRAEVRHVVAAPWFLLRQEYAEAAQDIQAMVTEMDAFAHRSFKGQRGTGPEPRTPEPTQEASSAPAPAAEPLPVESAHVQVHSPNLGALLDFQERLTNLPEVARVSMSQVNEDRAVLIVDLDVESEAATG